MKIRLSGLSKASDTLVIETPRQVEWQEVTGLLNIGGAECYRVGNASLSVRFKRAVAIPDFTAQCLLVVMQPLGITVETLAIDIHDHFIKREAVTDIANDIWMRLFAVPSPQTVPPERVESRGLAPAYWLH